MGLGFFSGNKNSSVSDSVFMKNKYERERNTLECNVDNCNDKVVPLLKALGILSIDNCLHYCYVKDLNVLKEEYIKESEAKGMPPSIAKKAFEDFAVTMFQHHEDKEGNIIFPSLYINKISDKYKGCLYLTDDEETPLKIDNDKFRLNFNRLLSNKEKKAINNALKLVDTLNSPEYEDIVIGGNFCSIYRNVLTGKWEIHTENIIKSVNNSSRKDVLGK